MITRNAHRTLHRLTEPAPFFVRLSDSADTVDEAAIIAEEGGFLHFFCLPSVG